MNAATFAGNLTANGNIVLGNATSDTIALTGIVSIGTSGSYLANLGGTVLLPTYTFTGDLNTGIWSSGADAIDISTAGVQRVRVDSAGVVQIGSSATPPAASIRLGQLFTIHTSANYGGPSINTWSTTAAEGPLIDFNRSKSATIGTMTVVGSADLLGMVSFRGADGTNFINAATIAAYVDGTPGTNDMPGRLVFSTTADGASSVTERMRITSGGYVGIGATTPLSNLHVAMETNVNPRNITNQFSAAATGGARFDSLKSRGSISSPTAIVNGDVIGTFAFKPHDGSSFLETAYIAGISNGTVAVGSVPTDLSFATGSASGSERMRIDSSGQVGIGLTPTARNNTCLQVVNGIGFPATQVSSSDANTLDDYEEGTWTPSVGGNATYIKQVGTYTKIGRHVYFSCLLHINAIGTGSATTVSGLPFTAAAGDATYGINVSYWTSAVGTFVYLGGEINASSTNFIFYGATAAATALSVPVNVFQNSTLVRVSGHYIV